MSIFAATRITELGDQPFRALVRVVEEIEAHPVDERQFVIEYDGHRFIRTERQVVFWPGHRQKMAAPPGQ